MRTSNYRIASLTLIAVSAGFLISYPFHSTFYGGLLASGFSAAMVGGLADWFAVTALFRRPLGLRPGRVIRTEIIPRNRERIFAALTDMVQNELLSKETLKHRLDSYDVADLILRNLSEHGGSQDLRELAARLIEDSMNRLDPKAVGELANSLVKENAFKLAAAPLVAEIIEFSSKMGYVDRLITFATGQLASFVRLPQTGRLIYELVRESILVYERGMDRRKLANSLIGISPVQLTEEIQTWLAEFLGDLENSTSYSARQRLKEWIRSVARELRSNPEWQRRLEHWMHRLAGEKLEVGQAVTTIVRAYASESRTVLGERILELVDNKLRQFTARLEHEQDLRRQLDSVVKNFLLKSIEARHGEIGKLVQTSLERLDNQMLVELIEEKAGNDLQMIRINGSVVGGLSGILLYIMTYWLR